MREIHLKDIDLNLLVTFSHIYAEGGVTQAGQKLGRTQSAVSHALERLRDLFGDRLFMRTSKGMVPTPKCKSLYQNLAPCLSSLADAINSGQETNPAKWKAKFNLCMSDYCESVLLPALTEKVLKEAQGLEISIVSPARVETEEALRKGEIDLFIGNRRFGEDASREFLFTDEFACLAPKTLGGRAKTMSAETYQNNRHVLYTPAGGAQDRVIADFLKKRGVEREVALRVPGILGIPYILAKSSLIATVPENIAKLIQTPELKILRPPFRFPKLEVFLFWNRFFESDPAHIWLREQIRSHCRSFSKKNQ